MNIMLTPKQRQSYQFIRSYLAEHGYAPSLEEIRLALGSRSRTSAFNHVRGLEAAGLIRLAGGRKRNIELVETPDTTLPLAGKIAAGQPIEAIENQDHVDLSRFFMGPDRFILKVAGESMIEAGIMDGDMVIVKQQQSARNGDIVVALIDSQEATLKYIHYNKDDSISLKPANRKLSVMHYPAERVQIQGVVVGQMRSYE
jgi:repressor LexA